MADWKLMAQAPDVLSAFTELLDDLIISQAVEIVGELAGDIRCGDLLGRKQRKLALALVLWLESNPECGEGDAWQLYLVEKILEGQSSFGERASIVRFSKMGESLQEMARKDLRLLQSFYGMSSRKVLVTLQEMGLESLPSWDNGLDKNRIPPDEPLRMRLHGGEPWEDLVEVLADYYYRHGTGSLGHFHAFRWDAAKGLIGVPKPDPITLDDLAGYEYQRSALLANTEQFLAGFPCNNILLYGARGTGKSSMVKALLNAYAAKGLRLVEVAREDVQHFPAIVRQLRDRPQRFILFADDLSYDDSELHYRELKAALEGTVEGRPENVLLYATSNRRHIIKERFRDRDSADDEIHTHDTAQEKLSLADRFGLTLSFAAPSQSDYLDMVELIAARRGLRVPQEGLHRGALQWAAMHNVPSGRTARQFVDDLEGRLRVAEDPDRSASEVESCG